MKKIISSLLIAVFALSFSFNISAQKTISGKWKTIDDETNKEKSIVQIWFDKDKTYKGMITHLYEESKRNNTCTACLKTDKRYNKKIVGMIILTGLKKKGKEWSGGQILDPNNGKIYKCKVWIEGNNLKLRGYIGPFYRTQTWVPVK